MRNVNIILIIVIIFIALPIGIIASKFDSIKNTFGFTNEQVFVYVIVGTGVFIFAITSNLVTYIITYLLDQKHMNQKQLEALSSIEEIRKYLMKKSIVLNSKDRKKLLDVGFYDKIYNDASDIRISGVRLTPLVDYICKKDKNTENWVKKLENKQDVSVKILMTSSESKIISIWEDQEGLPRDAIKNEIIGNIEKLRLLSTFKKIKLAARSSISIRTIRDIQYFNISYAGNVARKDTDKLLLSFSFNRDEGPVYEIRPINEVNTYEECLSYFDRVYGNGIEIFRWDNTGIKFTPEPK